MSVEPYQHRMRIGRYYSETTPLPHSHVARVRKKKEEPTIKVAQTQEGEKILQAHLQKENVFNLSQEKKIKFGTKIEGMMPDLSEEGVSIIINCFEKYGFQALILLSSYSDQEATLKFQYEMERYELLAQNTSLTILANNNNYHIFVCQSAEHISDFNQKIRDGHLARVRLNHLSSHQPDSDDAALPILILLEPSGAAPKILPERKVKIIRFAQDVSSSRQGDGSLISTGDVSQTFSQWLEKVKQVASDNPYVTGIVLAAALISVVMGTYCCCKKKNPLPRNRAQTLQKTKKEEGNASEDFRLDRYVVSAAHNPHYPVLVYRESDRESCNEEEESFI